jgi:hypothetical protein
MPETLTPYHFWARFLGELACEPEMQRRFLFWVASHHPEEWGRYARSRGRPIDDPALILDCADAGSRALMMALTAELQRLGAIVEAQQVLNGGL